jgi:hypothetical protein
VKYRLLYNSSVLEVLDDDSFQKLRRHPGVPHALRIDHHDGTSSAYAEARGFAALHSLWPEEKSFALEKRRELRVKSASATIRRAEPACANQHVTGVLLHERLANGRNTQGDGSPSTSLLSPGGAMYL